MRECNDGYIGYTYLNTLGCSSNLATIRVGLQKIDQRVQRNRAKEERWERNGRKGMVNCQKYNPSP